MTNETNIEKLVRNRGNNFTTYIQNKVKITKRAFLKQICYALL